MPTDEESSKLKAADDRALRVAKRSRNGYKLNVTNALTKLQQQIVDGVSDDELKISIMKLDSHRQEIDDLDSQILPLLPDEEFDGALQDTVDLKDSILEKTGAAKNLMDSRLAQKVSQSSAGASSSATINRPPAPMMVKLPKLDIRKYDGDPLAWREFWDSFRSTIHDNAQLSKVEKFKYLKQYLKGEAFSVVDGFPLSDDSYDSVVKALAERFGDDELAIFAHLDAMHSLAKSSNDMDDIQRVLDKVNVHIRCLDHLGVPEDSSGRFYIPLILSKLPTYIRVEVFRRNGSKKFTLDGLRKHLREELDARHMGKLALGETNANTGKPPQNGKGKPWNSQNFKFRKGEGTGGTTSSLLASSKDSKGKGPPHSQSNWNSRSPNPKYPCVFCKCENHFPDQCGKFADLKSRTSQLKDNCHICLSVKHATRDCPVTKECPHCQQAGKHHRSLCPIRFGGKPNSGVAASCSLVAAETGLFSQASHQQRIDRISVLPTAQVTVSGEKDSQTARLLLDTGSTRSFGRLTLLQQVGARCLPPQNIALAGIESEKRTKKKYPCYELTLQDNNGKLFKIALTGLASVTCPVEKQVINPNKYPILEKVELAELLAKGSEEVTLDIVIGLDYYYDIVGVEQIRLDNGLVLLESRFGYIISGYVRERVTGNIPGWTDRNDTTMVAISDVNKTDELKTDLERLWRLEEIGFKGNTTTTEDELAQRKFNDTVRYDKNLQRYFVCWPYKSECPELPNNYNLALGRLRSLLRRLNSETFDKYNAIICDQWTKGIIELAPEKPDSTVVHYIPHHVVIKPESATTKLRVVYDASCRASKAAPSLNESLYQGPVLMADLCGLLLRFRMHRIAIVSDIEKAFLQVGLQVTERDVTRFLWVRDLQNGTSPENLVVLRFARVLFGIVCSPFLLAATIKRHLEKCNTPVSRDILRNLYIDNVITGVETEEKAGLYYTESKSLLSSASMNLREWFSNSQALLESIPEKDRGSSKTPKVLGMKWDTVKDTLQCTMSSAGSTEPCTTKRQILRRIAKLYDPNGMFCSVTIRGKILLQELWRRGLDWDDTIPDDLQACWEDLAPDVSAIVTITVPRYVGRMHENGTHELHCFCDASEKAYAVAVYLRTNSSSTIATSLLFAKAKVSPLKDQALTIPKLELTAIAVGCKMLSYVQQETGLNCKRVAWSDSQCALQWCANKTTSPRFVGTRVKEISSSSVELRYVPTSLNPADMPSRGVPLDKLKDSELWWYGPPFLRYNQACWPSNCITEVKSGYDNTADAQVLLATATPASRSLLKVGEYSSLSKLSRVTAWIQRLVANMRRQYRSGELQASEIKDAKVFWIRVCQRKTADALRAGKRTENSRQLGLFLDDDGLVRCSGKLDNSDLPYSTKYPIYLSRKDLPEFCDLVIKEIHTIICHAGVEHVVSELRQEFWLPKCKSEVKRVLRQCKVCKRVKGGPFKMPPSPPLPDFRSTRQQSFATVGIDYLGPLMIRTPNGSQKVWIGLFTCAVSRAIHLEVVTSLTTGQFLLALRRFMSLYGKPDRIICDNAKQFHSARKATESLLAEVCRSDEVQAHTAAMNITWKFIVELAPWMGGFYERLVGLVKNALKCSVNNRKLDLIELQTVCCEIAGTLNSRPLTWMSDDVGSRALTPKDLLSMSRSNFPSIDVRDADSDSYGENESASQAALKAQWKRIQACINSFWDKWHKDYLTSLRERSWQRKAPRGCCQEVAKTGTVVLMHEKNIPKSQWRIGVITELVSSGDGEVRSAMVRLSDGKTLHRPLKLLYPLEIPSAGEPVDTGDNKKQPETGTEKLPKNLQRRPAAEKSRQQCQIQLRQLDASEDEE